MALIAGPRSLPAGPVEQLSVGFEFKRPSVPAAGDFAVIHDV
jgi:hypothetical protein